MFKRFALAATLFAFAGLLPAHGRRGIGSPLSPLSSPKHLCRRSFQRRLRPWRTVLRMLLCGSIFRAASITMTVNVGMGARSTAPTLVKKRRSELVIEQAKMDNSARPSGLRLRLLLLTAALLGTGNVQSAAAAAQHGSAALCSTIGPHVVAADADLAPAAQTAVALGTDDTEVLSGTRARYGSAFKLGAGTNSKSCSQRFSILG